MFSRKLILFLFLAWQLPLHAQQQPVAITFSASPGSIPLAAGHQSPVIIYDPQDAEVVGIAAAALQKDMQLVTGLTARLATGISPAACPVIIGSLGRSAVIDQLARAGKIPAEKVRGKWETFCISLVRTPAKGVKQALVIFGSDPRGTAFGVFELSRMMGVSPFVWWADVTPEQHEGLYIIGNESITGPPSVKYRGIFLNDEDWGLQPWAAKQMDTDVKDIGPGTYEKIFELMLRLKANYLWPAMHPCTRAFWYYDQNPVLARKYGIVLGASHCEPLLRNNVFEWDHHFEQEYGVKPGEWRYDRNREQIDRYWRDRVLQSRDNAAVYTVGMRGIHDGSMPGPPSKEGKKQLLEEVIRNQRSMLSEGLGKPAGEIPQIFCPYKEVLDLYRLGMDLPDDITLAWADDNYGYIRQLSNPAEQQRSGGSGVYYHLSYWGAPADYLWLSTISPSLISYELSKAYQLKAQRLWVFNVGDIKPCEAELQFAMDLAWDVAAWSPEKAQDYPYHWAESTFGKAFARDIGDIKKAFYRLAATGKPEHLDKIAFTPAEIRERLSSYQVLAAKARTVGARIPARLKDAWFELVAYPVEAAAAMNEKVLYARESLRLAAEGDATALEDAEKARQAYTYIRKLTGQYNKGTAGGKWDGIMDDAPRKQAVFRMPEVAMQEMMKAAAVGGAKAAGDEKAALPPAPPGNILTIPASGFTHKTDGLQLIEGLGATGSALTAWPLRQQAFDIERAPYADYRLSLHKGPNRIIVKCLPDFPLYAGMKLRYAISIDGAAPVPVDIATLAETKPWAVNLLRGYAAGETVYNSNEAGGKTVRIYFPDPGLVVSAITCQ